MTYLSDFSIYGTGIDSTILSNSTTKVELSNFTWTEAENIKMTISAISVINGIKTGQEDILF